MPRKSRADHLKVVSLRRPRLEAPKSLDAAEAKTWRTIVDASPDGYLDGASQLILRQVVCQVAVADRHAERLRALASQPEDHVEAEIAIGRAHREATASVIKGMAALRATPRSRAMSRDAGRLFDREPPSGQVRPWEVRAPTIDHEADGDASA